MLGHRDLRRLNLSNPLWVHDEVRERRIFALISWASQWFRSMWKTTHILKEYVLSYSGLLVLREYVWIKPGIHLALP